MHRVRGQTAAVRVAGRLLAAACRRTLFVAYMRLLWLFSVVSGPHTLWGQLQQRFASSDTSGLKAYKPTTPGAAFAKQLLGAASSDSCCRQRVSAWAFVQLRAQSRLPTAEQLATHRFLMPSVRYCPTFEGCRRLPWAHHHISQGPLEGRSLQAADRGPGKDGRAQPPRSDHGTAPRRRAPQGLPGRAQQI